MKRYVRSNMDASTYFNTDDVKFPLGVRFYKYRQEIDNLIASNSPELNTYCLLVNYGHQYAAGVTGTNRSSRAYIDNSTQRGWRTKGQAYAAAKEAGIKSYHKRGSGDQGYGDVGSKWQTVEAIKISELFSLRESRNIDVPKYFEGI